MSKELIKLLGSLRTGSIAAIAFACAIPAQVSAQDAADDGEPVEEVEGFTITGSRIKRIDMETVSPVIAISGEDLQETGFTTVGDAIRALPFNNGQALTPADSGTSFTPGVSSANLRGLGNNNTLVLINGRRTAAYATPGFDGFQTVFDFNSLPAAAIDSIQVLKDGGSAIYGSDAVAGVVNVILRDDYEGAYMSGQVGNYFDTDGLLLQGSVLVGASNARTNIVATFDWQQQNAVFARDLDYSADANKDPLAADADPRFIAFVTDEEILDEEGNVIETRPRTWEEAGYASEEAWILADENLQTLNPIDYGWFDLRSTRGYPGYVTVDGTRYTFAEPTTNPTQEGAIAGRNFWNYQGTNPIDGSAQNGLFPEWRRYSFYSRVRHELSDTLYAFGEFSFSRVESEVHSAPTPVDIENSLGFINNDPEAKQMRIPGSIEWTNPETDEVEVYDNPMNPWDTDITNGRLRFLTTGNRINETESDTPRILIGLGGDFAEDWSWEVGVLYTKNTLNNTNAGSIPDYRLQEALYGLTRLGDGSLTWDPSTNPEERVYFNWFGPNDEAFADFLATQNPQISTYELVSYDASVNGSLFDLPAGAVGFAAGAERRVEELANIRTDLNATGNILGGSEGVSTFGERDVSAVYAELQIPVLEMLEVQLAGRYEDYSDEGFSDDVRPKIGAKFQPLDWLILRASYSESFKAPDLAYLYTSSQTSFSSSQVIDPTNQETIDQIQIVTAGNPDLEPELTDTYYAGIVIEPGGALDGLLVSVDYVIFDQTNLLSQLSDIYSYQDFLIRADEGEEPFVSKVVRSDATGQVLYILDDYENLSSAEYKGWDFRIRYDWRTEVAGDFTADLNVTWIDSYEIDDSEIVGSRLTPEWRGTFLLGWERGDWGASIFTTYIDARDYSESYGVWDPDVAVPVEWGMQYTVQEQWVVNVRASYAGLWDTKITVGVNNVLNEDPPIDPYEGAGTTPGVNYIEPAFYYVRFERDF